MKKYLPPLRQQPEVCSLLVLIACLIQVRSGWVQWWRLWDVLASQKSSAELKPVDFYRKSDSCGRSSEMYRPVITWQEGLECRYHIDPIWPPVVVQGLLHPILRGPLWSRRPVNTCRPAWPQVRVNYAKSSEDDQWLIGFRKVGPIFNTSLQNAASGLFKS